MNIPNHIGIVLDGNRRYAREKGKKPWQGHTHGKDNVRNLFDWAKELGIKELTLFSFSMQNFKRSKEEVEHMFNLFRKGFKELKKDMKKLKEEGLKINFIGRTEMFPEDIREMMDELMETTKEHNNYIVNFAMGYGGQEEILDAVKKIANKVEKKEINSKEINKETIKENLYLQSEPDLIIRTGGDKRTSNFLMWQSWYSEWFFLEKYWPEFSKEDLLNVIEEFNGRQRRFGK